MFSTNLEGQFFDAIKENNVERVGELLDQGVNPNQFNKDGLTPLHVAANEKRINIEIIRLLLKNGADPNKTCDGMRPIDIATLKGRNRVIDLLIKENSPPSTYEWGDYDNFQFQYSHSQPFINKMKGLGYQIDPLGMCGGWADAGTEALVLTDRDENGNLIHLNAFKKRVAMIEAYTYEKLSQKIEETKQKVVSWIKDIKEEIEKWPVEKIEEEFKKLKQNEPSLQEFSLEQKKEMVTQAKIEEAKQNNLTEEERIFLDIHAFFDRVVIYQDSNHKLYPSLLEDDGERKYSSIASPIVGSLILSNQGNLASLGEFSGAYTCQDLRAYFKSFEKVLKEENPPFDHPIALVLRSSHHIITIGYDPKRNVWTRINAGTDGGQPQEVTVERLTESFDLGNVVYNFSTNHVAILSTQICVAKDPEKTKNPQKIEEYQQKLNNCIARWRNQPEMREIHQVTPEKAKLLDSFGASWLHLAAECSEVDTVKKLLKNGANPKQAAQHTPDEKPTPLHFAARSCQPEILKMLLSYNIDKIPAFIKASASHPQLVAALSKSGFNINQKLTNAGDTVSHIAAKAGDLGMLRVIDKLGGDFNIKSGSIFFSSDTA